MKKGQSLEYLIDVANDTYRKKGYGNIYKTEPIIKIITKIGNMITKGYIQDKGQLDFVGCLAGGLYIEFDAKESQRDNLPMTNIKPHQVDTIEEVLKNGGVSFLVTDIKSGLYVIPGAKVVEKYRAWEQNQGIRGFGNIGPEDMIAIGSREGIPLDYLAAVVELKQ